MILDGIDTHGEQYHAWSTSFTGKGGPASVIVTWHEDAWDANSTESFIAGLH
jgi:hypothetical protein